MLIYAGGWIKKMLNQTGEVRDRQASEWIQPFIPQTWFLILNMRLFLPLRSIPRGGPLLLNLQVQEAMTCSLTSNQPNPCVSPFT